jgi:hypothetical protein
LRSEKFEEEWNIYETTMSLENTKNAGHTTSLKHTPAPNILHKIPIVDNHRTKQPAHENTSNIPS